MTFATSAKYRSVTAHAASAARRRAFVRRMYVMRNLGVWLVALPFCALMHEQGAGVGLWLVMALTVLVWPHLAFLLARQARLPVEAEFRNLLFDVVLIGFWIAVTGVSLMLSTVAVSVLASDRLAAGGWKLAGRAVVVGGIAFGLSWWAAGFPFRPMASMTTLVLSVPPILVYSLALSYVSYRLARRISHHNRELDRLSTTDSGVPLPNRRSFNTCAEQLIKQARASGGPAVLLLVDIDRFKPINDRLGHLAGDEVLRAVSLLLGGIAGERGFPARIGGDEFALLLPATQAQGEQVAAELKRAVAALVLPQWPSLRVSASVGVSALQPGHADLDAWFTAADAAMYRAKASAAAVPEAALTMRKAERR